jgi:hypothetical protein
MRTNCRKKPLTFGEFIIAVHEARDGKPAGPGVEPATPLPAPMKTVPTAKPAAVFRIRLTAKIRAAIASRVPVGYEDETEFHYGVNPGD